MPSSEECIDARNDVRRRCIKKLVDEGHPLKSAEEIVRFMSYEEQAAKIGQRIGEPYSAY